MNAELFVALGGALAIILTTLSGGIRQYLLAWFEQRTKRMVRAATEDGLKRMSHFARCLHDIDQMKFVDRVILFNGRNCGGLPAPGNKYTVEVVDGWCSGGKHDPRALYSGGLIVDGDYCDMLAEMVGKGKKVNTVSDMPKSAALRSFYEEEGVFQTALFYLGCDGQSLTYLSVGNYSRAFEPGELIRLERVVQRLQTLVN